MIGELWIAKDVEESGRDLLLRNYPSSYVEGLRKTMKTLSGVLVSGPRFKPGPSEIRMRSVECSQTKT
jgi:hypothetical protein